MIDEYKKILHKANKEKEQIKKNLLLLEKRKTVSLIKKFHIVHEEVFADIDCLDCGNCCRHVGPRIIEPDVPKLAKAVSLKKNAFINQYLKEDEEGDMVFEESPCPFLGEDNFCFVYDSRPRACRDYPHTHDRDIHKRLKRLAIDVTFCPAAYLITERILEENLPSK